MNKIDLFPIATFPWHRGSSASLLLTLALQKEEKKTVLHRRKGPKQRGSARALKDLGSNPSSAALFASWALVSPTCEIEIRLSQRIIVLWKIRQCLAHCKEELVYKEKRTGLDFEMQSLLHRRLWQFFDSWGANLLPQPELGILSSSKSDSRCAFGQFMTLEGLNF